MNSRSEIIIKQLRSEIRSLKLENKKLLEASGKKDHNPKVKVPERFESIFKNAEKTVGEYFKSLKFSPSKGTIEVNGERYVLVRASALSHEFLNKISELYSDRGTDEAMSIGKNILFDVSHVIGMEDARNFGNKMDLTDPVRKLAAGPVHFAYTGWAFVDILPGSKPSPDENFFIKYNHPFSFEADSWIRAGKRSNTPVCIMGAGYSSGWCEASFGIQLTSVEISCRARGDKHCTFIMAPPSKIDSYLKQSKKSKKPNDIWIPSFLERKKIEEQLTSSVHEKEVLIKEIHHRVKNNLQIISSLLNLQADTINDDQARDKFVESIGRVRSMAIIHELLYRSKNLSNIKISDYLKELVRFVSHTYNVNSNIKVALKVNVENEFIDIDKAIPCGILINELLSNAYKHAFPNKRKGRITVELSESPKNGNRYRLHFKDDGVGLKLKSVKRSPTLGLQLIQSLVEQLQGKIKTETNKGTSFLITFP